MPDIWQMKRCNACASLFLDPRPDQTSLPHAYDVYYTHNVEIEELPSAGTMHLLWGLINGYLNKRFPLNRHPSSAIGYVVFTVLEPLRLKLDYYGRHLLTKEFPEPGRILDIGCGNGAFISRAQEMGWDVLGCEPDPKAAAACASTGSRVIVGDAFHPDLNGKQFNVITISHVIEHVLKPEALLMRAFELLRPEGTLWLALPNPNSLCLRVFKSSWNGLHFPFHICIPSQDAVRRLIADVGFVESRLMRRGMHARNTWRESTVIAQRDNQKLPPTPIQKLQCFFIDLVSAFSRKWADETVFIAKKPKRDREY